MSDPHAETETGGTAQAEARGPRMPGYLYPLLGLAFGGALVWSFSRILLAVSKTDAAVIALLMALNILIGGALIAYGRRVRRRPTAFPLLVLAVLALIAAGATTSVVYGDRAPEEAAGGGPGGGPKVEKVTLVAEGTKFSLSDLAFTAGDDVQMTFDNKDAGVPHNFALFNGPDATAPPLFRGDPVTGPVSATYSFKAPPPGSYFFHCDIHPTVMTGTVTVAPAAPGGPPGGPPPGPLTITAKNTAFSPTSVQAPATGQVTIHFQNDDASVPHDIAIFKGTDATGEVVFRGDLVTGPAAVDYTFPAPPPGTYFFHCDVHPAQMTGTITFG